MCERLKNYFISVLFQFYFSFISVLFHVVRAALQEIRVKNVDDKVTLTDPNHLNCVWLFVYGNCVYIVLLLFCLCLSVFTYFLFLLPFGE